MKKTKFITSICTFAGTIVPVLALSSCSVGGGDKPIPPAPVSKYLEKDPYWTLNYSYETRRQVPFKFKMSSKFDGGEIINVDITSQKTTIENVYDLDAKRDFTIRVCEDSKQIKNDVDVIDDTQYLTTKLEFIDETIAWEDLAEVQFSLKFTITNKNGESTSETISDLFLDCAKPTFPDDIESVFKFDNDEHKTLLSFADGFDNNDEKNHYTFLVIPHSVETIDEYAFWEFSPGKNGTNIPDEIRWFLLDANWGQGESWSGGAGESQLKTIKHHAFFYLPSPKGNLYFPKNIEFIGFQAFLDADFDGQIIFGGNNLKTIEAYAFSSCINVSGELDIPCSQEGLEIGSYAFQECRNVTSIKLHKNTKLGDGVFKNGNKVSLLDFSDWEIPSDTRYIDAFEGVGSAVNGEKVIYIPDLNEKQKWVDYLSSNYANLPGVAEGLWTFKQKKR